MTDYLIVAVKERCDGNESVGSMWLETAIFKSTDRLSEVMNWAEKFMGKGKTILTIPTETREVI